MNPIVLSVDKINELAANGVIKITLATSKVYHVGDMLWVREYFQGTATTHFEEVIRYDDVRPESRDKFSWTYTYLADRPQDYDLVAWCVPQMMPQKASRFTVRVASVMNDAASLCTLVLVKV